MTAVHGINYWDHEVACRTTEDPVLVTSDLDKITCDGCRKALIRSEAE